MAKVNFYLRDKTSEKQTPILLYVSYGGVRLTKYPTGETILPEFWDDKHQRAKQTKKNPTHPELNVRLNKIAEKAEDLLRRYQNDFGELPPLDKYKEILRSTFSSSIQPKKIDLMTFLDNLMVSYETMIQHKTGRPMTKGSLVAYKQTLRIFKEFKEEVYKNKPLDFEHIDSDFAKKFQQYLINRDFKTNTIGRHAKTLKTFFLEANEQGYMTNKFSPKKLVRVTEKVDSIYLDNSEIKKLIDLDLSKYPKYIPVRDAFIIGCLTGLRFSDFTRIAPSNIEGDFITIETQKTVETVVIPIHSEVHRIINHYKSISHNTGLILPKPISNQKMNDYLKEIGKLAEINNPITIKYTRGGKVITETVEKYKLISTHTARRSFATNQYKLGISASVIMRITGHRTETSFMNYIKITSNESAEILRKAWLNNI